MKGGDRVLVIGEGGFKMSNCLKRGIAGGCFRLLTDLAERCSDSALDVEKAFPESIWGRLFGLRCDIVKSLLFRSGRADCFEKVPKRECRDPKCFQFVSRPNTSCPSAAWPPFSVAAKDSACSSDFRIAARFIIATEESMKDEGAHEVTMRAWRDFELFIDCLKLRLGGIVSLKHGSLSP